ncbi:MAG: efflux RND transporter permease subunit [Pseudomonadota bacterium]
MHFLKALLRNHVFANLVFVLVILLGIGTYLQMPKAKDPPMKLNWVNIVTRLPGASAEDIEKRITDPIEEVIQRAIDDIKFVASTSREGVSNVIVRFDYVDERTYDKRTIDLRREVQNVYNDQLPDDADDPYFLEITSSNWFPTATIAVSGQGDDENLRRQARYIKRDIENINGVDEVNPLGLKDPELRVEFDTANLRGLGISPAELADTVNTYFRDVSVGDLETESGRWLVRLAATSLGPEGLAEFPIVTGQGVVRLGDVARISLTTEDPDELVRYRGRPGVMMAITKTEDANVLDLVERLNAYVDKRNELTGRTGAELFLVDDQTVSTREALTVMQTNAMIGFVLVVLVAWLFLGLKVSLLTSIGIPFTLACTFIALHLGGMTINNTVLLGIVICLGMIVDDAVVVVESIYHQIESGARGAAAAVAGLREVFAPVTTSVMTTIAAFLPLALLPGILGEFMRVIPIVVSAALALSLLEAYWMLPAHVVAAGIKLDTTNKLSLRRQSFTRVLRRRYTQLLLKALRAPWITALAVAFAFVIAIGTLSSGLIRFNFFEGDPVRVFYVSVEMPPGTALEQTASVLSEIEEKALAVIAPEELRGSIAYAGQMFTETDNFFGDVVGQIMISLNPTKSGGRGVFEIADAVEAQVKDTLGPKSISMLRIKDGPPTQRAVAMKIRGDDYADIQKVTEHMRAFLETHEAFNNVAIDYRSGNPELVLRLDGEAIKRSGADPLMVRRSLALMVDGELITDYQKGGEEVRVRVLSQRSQTVDIRDLLREVVPLPNGGEAPLGELVIAEETNSQYNIRHHNFSRAITLESDIDKERIDTVAANALVVEQWQKIASQHPNISIDFTGEFDDIQESLDAIFLLLCMGVGLMYIILGTQFRSYWQPLLILFTVPLAFCGVILGLLGTGNPMSLYTIYGMVALAGIAVNASIVLISAANSRLKSGMSLLHATVYAARRRVIPIIITSATTIAGLFSLAVGLAGESAIWGPVATAIVWGLAFSTTLTLFVIPMLYRAFMSIGFLNRGFT